MDTFELINSVSELGILVTLLQCFMQTFLVGIPLLDRATLWYAPVFVRQSNMPWFVRGTSWAYMTDDIVQIFV